MAVLGGRLGACGSSAHLPWHRRERICKTSSEAGDRCEMMGSGSGEVGWMVHRRKEPQISGSGREKQRAGVQRAEIYENLISIVGFAGLREQPFNSLQA